MIRTIEQLIDKIAEDIIWRRKELTVLKSLVQESKCDFLRSRVLIRGSVALLYAHWEGFVKKSSSYYLEYVASHRLPYKQLSSNFVGLTLRAKFSELGASEMLSRGNELADFFCTALDKKSNIPYRKSVDTKSNLSSKVLIDILEALGLDATQFKTRLNFIDSNLVNPRNYIAHGANLNMNIDEYLELHEAVLALILTYRNEVENASVQRRFERPAV
jgi:hypothetical protein